MELIRDHYTPGVDANGFVPEDGRAHSGCQGEAVVLDDGEMRPLLAQGPATLFMVAVDLRFIVSTAYM
jgi:hypothetical protein